MTELQASAEAAAESLSNAKKDSPKSKKTEESSSDSTSDSDSDDSTSEESVVSLRPVKGRKQTGPMPLPSYNSEDESRSSSEATARDIPRNKSAAEDSESDIPEKKRASIPRLIPRRPSSRSDSVDSISECKCQPPVYSRRKTITPPSRKQSWWNYIF
uniref:PPUP7845 n=1 Tax=Poeciliopsis prolifica TaxID=188132 RepID=A0A0S7EU19_9TELE